MTHTVARYASAPDVKRRKTAHEAGMIWLQRPASPSDVQIQLCSFIEISSPEDIEFTAAQGTRRPCEQGRHTSSSTGSTRGRAPRRLPRIEANVELEQHTSPREVSPVIGARIHVPPTSPAAFRTCAGRVSRVQAPRARS